MNVEYGQPCAEQYARALRPLPAADEIRMNQTTEHKR